MDPRRLRKLLLFLAAGLPAFGIAVPLNWLLAERWAFYPAIAYALVLVIQVTINFFMCKWLVFERRAASSLWREFTTFFTGIALFRLADWAVYSAVVALTPMPPVAMQLINVALFSMLKFLFSERTLEGPARDGSDAADSARAPVRNDDRP